MFRRHFINVSYSGDIQPNQIWYKTSNGEKFEYELLMARMILKFDMLPLTSLKTNRLIHDDWWCLTFTNNITYIGLTDESRIGPSFYCLFDVSGIIETNVLNIIEIRLPSISSIGIHTFFTCLGLQSITIPNSVTSIGAGAFWSCDSLTSITIPESVINIGKDAFYDCASLTSVTINSDTIVSKKYSLSSTIYDIFGLQVTEYIIGDNVKGIGEYTFGYCSELTSVTIPKSVTSIGVYAFRSCSSLTSITFNGTKDQWKIIELGSNWNDGVPAAVVHCIDGDVAI